ncbi:MULTISPECIES: nucleotidyltransferase domain-containing protein [unclassified Providencia]|uniref:nucleotidyltransferase domain-containing protein n=1 Tax=unclassified Providencia TaxID=2633465 RepID=UPI00234A276A|nr:MULTISPECIES: nucleotidyltransferase domain-containing protein [unclassified Providencia]
MSKYDDYVDKFLKISELRINSNNVLTQIRKELEQLIDKFSFKNEVCLITTGSFGRAEASDESDMDFFILCDSDENKKLILAESEKIDSIIKKYVPKNTGSTGTFGAEAINTIEEITSNIGGRKDTNELLTRRMLFILEGAYLFNEKKFKEYRELLVDKYLEPTMGNYLDRYLLNDIIRYYRTITTDFQFKVDENDKEWGLRNIKLKFSRKILYYSGILSVIHTYLECSSAESIKKEILLDLLSKPVIERIYSISQKYNSNSELDSNIYMIFTFYDLFLQQISISENRIELEKTTKENRSDSKVYIKLNMDSKHFTTQLYLIIDEISKKDDEVLECLIF